MAASSLHVSEEYLRIINDFDVICDLHTEDKDHLCVFNGSLHINRGGFLQGPTRTFYSLFSEGYNYQDVIVHLEGLKNRNIEYLNRLNQTPISLSDLAVFQRKVHLVAVKISELEFTLRTVIPLDMTLRMSQLNLDFMTQSTILEDFINRSKQPDWQPPRIELNIDEPVAYRKLMHTIPSGVTVQDIVRLAETAEAQRTPEVSTSELAIMTAEIGISSLATLPFSLLKVAVLNPINTLTGRYVEGKSPTVWAIDNIMQKHKKTNIDPLLDSYARVVLEVPFIQDEHVDAFCSLARHINTSFDGKGPIFLYQFASNEVEELLEIAEATYFFDEGKYRYGEEFAQLSPLAKEALGRMVDGRLLISDQIGNHLLNSYAQLRWIENPNWKPRTPETRFETWKQGYHGNDTVQNRIDYYVETCNGIKPYSGQKSLISVNNMLRVINAIIDNPRCNLFTNHSNMHLIPRLHNRLIEGGFVRSDNDYIRLSTPNS